MIEWFMCINAVIPVMIFGFVGTKSSFVSVNVEDYRIDRFQVLFQSFLEGITLTINTNLFEVQCHLLYVI